MLVLWVTKSVVYGLFAGAKQTTHVELSFNFDLNFNQWLSLTILYHALLSCCIHCINHNQSMESFVLPSSSNPLF